VQLWLSEVDGPVDLTSPTHQALLPMLGAKSRQGLQRARFRPSAAMQAKPASKDAISAGATVRVSDR
jgi:hypothetical protein